MEATSLVHESHKITKRLATQREKRSINTAPVRTAQLDRSSMATDDMDEQLFRQQHGWSLQLQSGQEIRLTPPGPKEASETLCVTDVFLVDPESTGVVAA